MFCTVLYKSSPCEEMTSPKLSTQCRSRCIRGPKFCEIPESYKNDQAHHIIITTRRFCSILLLSQRNDYKKKKNMIEELYRKTHNSAEASVCSHICREDIQILPKFFKKLVVTGSKIRFRKEVIEFILERIS